MWISLILSSTMGFAAPESSLHMEAPVTEKKAPWEIHFYLEGRAKEDLRNRPQVRSQQTLQEVALGATYRLDEQTTISAEVANEYNATEEEHEFHIKQAWVRWTPWTGLETRLGQMFLPVGLLNEREHLYSSLPDFYRRLFTVNNANDLGVVANWTPVASIPLTLEAGIFAGRLSHEGSSQPPERPPTLFTLKSVGENYSAFFTHYRHDLGLHEPVNAWGLGGEWILPFAHDWQMGVLAEGWWIHELQTLGPDQQTLAYLASLSLDWRRIQISYRWSRAESHLRLATGDQNLPYETSQLFAADVGLTRYFRLRAERVHENHGGVTRDEWVGRAIVEVH